MNRETFEKYLGKKVRIDLSDGFDGEIVQGFLHKTGEKRFENNPNLYIPKNYYFLVETENSKETCSCLFKMSHVKKIGESK